MHENIEFLSHKYFKFNDMTVPLLQSGLECLVFCAKQQEHSHTEDQINYSKFEVLLWGCPSNGLVLYF